MKSVTTHGLSNRKQRTDLRILFKKIVTLLTIQENVILYMSKSNEQS